ncbi:MAG: hypothetical protein K0S37_4113, partial [Microbacterium sp.]|nr:hypothetical protein [Microbacterium sp.]
MFRSSMKRSTSSAVALVMTATALLFTPFEAGATVSSDPKDSNVRGVVTVADEFDELREKYKVMLTGGTAYSLADPDIAGRIAEITDTA